MQRALAKYSTSQSARAEKRPGMAAEPVMRLLVAVVCVEENHDDGE
jgi:hypothetical protein